MAPRKNKSTARKKASKNEGRIRRFLIRGGAVLGAVLLCLWAVSWLWMALDKDKIGQDFSSWAVSKRNEVTMAMGLSVQDVHVEGTENADPQLVRTVINIHEGDPLIAVDPAEARAQVEKINWVKRARIERRLPGTVYVRIVERQALAIWQDDGKQKLIDQDGAVIEAASLEGFENLMIVEGDRAPEYTAGLIDDLGRQVSVYERTAGAMRVGGRRWDLRLTSGVEVKLPEDDIEGALGRLAQAQEDSQILDKDILYIDLRQPGRIVIKTKPGQVQDYSWGGQGKKNI